MPGQRSYVKGFVLRACVGNTMFKANEYDIEKTWTQEMRDQYAELEKIIDTALKAEGRCQVDIKNGDYKAVTNVIKWRYEQAGWLVEIKWRGGGSSGPPHDPYLDFRHPIEKN